MREYELIYVIQPDATPEREAEIHQRVDDLLQGAGARLLMRDDWGKRKLAYEIKHFQKGQYVQVNFVGGGSEVGEVERALRIDQDVLRFLTVQADPDVQDVEARIEEAKRQAAERARKREERAALEAERERARAESERDAGSWGADDGGDERPTLGPPRERPAEERPTLGPPRDAAAESDDDDDDGAAAGDAS